MCSTSRYSKVTDDRKRKYTEYFVLLGHQQVLGRSGIEHDYGNSKPAL